MTDPLNPRITDPQLTHKGNKIMPTYKCDDGNAEIEIEADTAQEAAEEYVSGGDWSDVTKTIWVNVYVQEVNACKHQGMTGDTCDECGERCTHADVGAGDDGICHDDECPIHGAQEVGERARIKVAMNPPMPKCPDHDAHDWQAPHHLVGGLKENPGVFGHGGGVIVKEVCMHCGCMQVTDSWAQDRETGEQGLTSVEYERDAFDVSDLDADL